MNQHPTSSYIDLDTLSRFDESQYLSTIEEAAIERERVARTLSPSRPRIAVKRPVVKKTLFQRLLAKLR